MFHPLETFPVVDLLGFMDGSYNMSRIRSRNATPERAAKDKYDKWTALRRESREYAREQARKHREILAQVEAELNLPKSLRRYAKKEGEILY